MYNRDTFGTNVSFKKYNEFNYLGVLIPFKILTIKGQIFIMINFIFNRLL